MKYVQVNDNIKIMANGQVCLEEDGIPGKPWPFARYLERIVLQDPAIGTSYKALKACAIVDAQFKCAAVGSWVGVEEEHWNMLKDTIENPKGGGISPGILRQFIPFMDAVLEARSEKPKE